MWRIVGDQIKEYAGADPNSTTVLSFEGTILNVRPSADVAIVVVLFFSFLFFFWVLGLR